MDMGIHVLDEYKGRGLSRLLMKELCIYIKNEYPKIRKDQLLFIDTDASWEYKKNQYFSFWDYIGMDSNRYYDSTNREIEGQGYEKKLLFKIYVNGVKQILILQVVKKVKK